MCELMIKELGAILTQIQVENKKSLNLSTYEDMKKLMTRILISKTEMNDKQRTYAQYELVKVFFKYFLVTQIKSVRYLKNSLFRVSPCKGKTLLVLLFHTHTHTHTQTCSGPIFFRKFGRDPCTVRDIILKPPITFFLDKLGG